MSALAIVDKLTARKLPPRGHKIEALILHTTGESDLGKCLSWYDSANGLQPHYVIAWGGMIYRIVPEDFVAYHTKIEMLEAALYEHGYNAWSRFGWNGTASTPTEDTDSELAQYAEWRDRWRPLGKQSPLDLITGAHPNLVSVGIELQAPIRTEACPRIFTDAQYESLAELIADICERNTVAVGRSTVFGHYDASPMRRSNSHGNWDPGAQFDWDGLFTLIGEV